MRGDGGCHVGLDVLAEAEVEHADVVSRLRGGGRDVADAERRHRVGAALLVGGDEEQSHGVLSRAR